MKTAWQHKHHWEEAQMLRLVYLYKQSSRFLNALANLLLYLAYKAIRVVFALATIVIATETSVRDVKDETWIFRQIK